MSKNIKYSKREFLTTQSNADSYISATVEYEAPKVVKGYGDDYVRKPHAHSQVKLTDCYRTITWEFCGKDALPKLRKTRKLLNEFFSKTEACLAAEKADKPLYSKLKKEFNARNKGKSVRRTRD